jgi:tRNA modification GTPase
LIREGATVVITGRVNAGKSSLFNALIGQERAIVTDVPGTTRDFLTETIDLHGLAVTLVDTAGERETKDTIEREGLARAMRARVSADLVLVVIDSGEELTDDDRRLIESSSAGARLIVACKADRAPRWERPDAIRVSTTRGDGLDDLRCAIVRSLTGDEGLRDPAAISNLRHVMLFKEARTALTRARTAIADQAPEEFVLADLHRARASFGEVVGIGSSEETLDYIFKHFCIGK